MEAGFRKINSLVLDGPDTFDDERRTGTILSPEERNELIKDIAKRCEISEERFRQILAEAGVEA